MSEEVINPRVGLPHTWIEAVWVVLHRAQDTCVQSEEEWEEVIENIIQIYIEANPNSYLAYHHKRGMQ